VSAKVEEPIQEEQRLEQSARGQGPRLSSVQAWITPLAALVLLLEAVRDVWRCLTRQQ